MRTKSHNVNAKLTPSPVSSARAAGDDISRREQIIRENLLSTIRVSPIDDGDVSILCPATISQRLHEHLHAKGVSTSLPSRAICGTAPDDELVVPISAQSAKAEVKEFVCSLPFEALPSPVPISLAFTSLGTWVVFLLLQGPRPSST